MNIKIEFHYGPLQVEVESNDDEEYDEVLHNVAEFIDNNKELFASVSLDQSTQKEEADKGRSGESGEGDTNLSQFTDSQDSRPDSNTSSEDTGWQPIVNATGVSQEKLRHLFGVGEDVLPQILFGESLTNESNTEQMLRGTLMILAVWEDYYGRESMLKQEITDILRKSGVQHENYHNVYQRSEFSTFFIRDDVSDEETGGETSEISLTPPGKSRAYELIEEYADDVDI